MKIIVGAIAAGFFTALLIVFGMYEIFRPAKDKVLDKFEFVEGWKKAWSRTRVKHQSAKNYVQKIGARKNRVIVYEEKVQAS